MRLEDVNTWDDYEEYMRSKGPEGVAVVEKCQRIADAVSAAMEALSEIHMGIDIYDLDEMNEEENAEAIPATV